MRRPGVLGVLGAVDQTLLRFMRTRLPHDPLTEGVFRTLGTVGEYSAVWIALGLGGAARDAPRRRRWLLASGVGPAAVAINYAVKVAVGRQRPLIPEHPPLARAPSKLSFPSAHATSSLAAATALGRVEPRTRAPLYALAAAVCLSRPYLGMHYPSDVVAGAALGTVIGGLVPGVGERTLEERMSDFVADRAREDRSAPQRATAPTPDSAPAVPPPETRGEPPAGGAG